MGFTGQMSYVCFSYSQPGVYLLSLHSSFCSATTVAPEDTAATVGLEGLAS